MDLFKQELDNLLNSYSDEILKSKKNAKIIFDNVKQNGILLFGSGGFGKKTFKGLQKIGIEPLGFIDKNPNLWNQNIERCKIYSPEEAVIKYPDAVYMVTIWSDKIGHPVDEIQLFLNTFGKVSITSFFWLYYSYPEIFLPYFSLDLPAKTLEQVSLIYKAFSLFGDEVSRCEFIAQLRMRLKEDVNVLGKAVGSKYHFSNDLFHLNKDDVIIDIGAFDGDTLKDFISLKNDVFKKYIAFEPDPENFNKLQKFVNTLPPTVSQKIITEQLAVSDKKKQITFDAEGSLQSAYNDNGNIIVTCISLDDFIVNEQPTYIKIDAEGAEPDIIKGAVNLIKNHAPILAISVYHQFDHLWSLPLAIKDISNEYSYYLRPLCNVSWDLICYVVPKQRLIKN